MTSRLLEQFPALKALGDPFRSREISVVRQTTATDCGAAALAMALGFFGRPVELEAIRRDLAIGRDGISAREIGEAAEAYGLRARGVKIDVADFEHLPRASIL